MEAFGTLLGPEITGPCFSWLSVVSPGGVLWAGAGGGVCCFWFSRACRVVVSLGGAGGGCDGVVG